MKRDYAISQTIEIIARGIIIHNEKILLCKGRIQDNYYFPGGHVEFDENSIQALKREIKEETGADIINSSFIGALENQFTQDRETKHELNIVFEAHLASTNIQNLEDHIECIWIPLTKYKETFILPESLKEKVFRWMQDKYFGEARKTVQS